MQFLNKIVGHRLTATNMPSVEEIRTEDKNETLK